MQRLSPLNTYTTRSSPRMWKPPTQGLNLQELTKKYIHHFYSDLDIIK